jgi:hypothetical protein
VVRASRQVKRERPEPRAVRPENVGDAALIATPLLPGLNAAAASDRAAMLAELDATLARLLVRAGPEGWPIRLDHCLLRVAYDNAVGMRWDRACRRPARAHLPLDALGRAVALLGEMEQGGRPAVAALNARSLAFRRAAAVDRAGGTRLVERR